MVTMFFRSGRQAVRAAGRRPLLCQPMTGARDGRSLRQALVPAEGYAKVSFAIPLSEEILREGRSSAPALPVFVKDATVDTGPMRFLERYNLG